MAHERISVTAWIAEFLNWRDTGLLLIFNTYKHTIKNKYCTDTMLLNIKIESKSLVG